MTGNGRFKRVLAVGVIATMVFSGFAFLLPGSGASEAPRAPAQGKLLRIAAQDDAKGLNPFAVNDVWSSNIIYNVFDGLVNRDWKTQKNQPWMVVGWKIEDGQPPNCENCNVTVEYKLGDWEKRWGGDAGVVYFHDGVKATLDDVLFSYGMTLYNPRWMSSVDPIIWKSDWSTPPYGDAGFMKVTVASEKGWLGVKKVDDHTLQFRLSKPYADFFDDTVSVVLFPKHIWESHINILDGSGNYMTWDMGYSDQTGEASGMIGSGPFVFEKWIKGQYAQEKKFENVNGHSYFDWTKLPRIDDYGNRLDPEQPAYDPAWTRNHPTPYIDGIIFKIYKTTDSAALAIKSDTPEVDFVAWSIPPTMVSDMQNNQNIGLFYTSEPGFFYQAFNMRRRTFGYENFQNMNYTDVGKPFRKAVAYGADKATIVSQLLQGYGKTALGPVSPDNRIWHNDSLPAYGLNPELAKKYLDDAGWIDHDGDGMREFPDVSDNVIEMLTPEASYDPIRAVAGQMIANSAQIVGINLKSVPMSFGEITQRIQRHDFELYILGWKISGSEPGGYLYSFFHCSQVDSQNYPGYCNASVDKMLEEYRSSFDKVKRIKLIKDVQGILVDDLPYNVLYYRTNIEATRRDKFAGWVQGSAGIYNGWSLLLLDSPRIPITMSFVNNRVKIVSGETMDVTVQVKDKSGTPIGDADVMMRIDSGASAAKLAIRDGYPGKTDNVTINGMTDASGFYRAKFETTPGLKENVSVSLSALAYKSGYAQAAPVQYGILVSSDRFPAISIDQFMIDPDTIKAGETAVITVRVVDAKGIPVPNANLRFEPSMGAVNPSSTTTAADGKASAIYTVPKEAPIGPDGENVQIIAKADTVINGYAIEASMKKSMTILPSDITIKEPPIPWLVIGMVSLVVAAVVVVVAVIVWKKRR